MSRLGRLDPQAGLGLLDRALDADDAFIEIDIFPAQRQRLTAAGAGPEQERHYRPQRAALEVAEQGADLVVGENGDLLFRQRWRADKRRDIGRHDTPGRGVPQHAVQHPMRVADAGRR